MNDSRRVRRHCGDIESERVECGLCSHAIRDTEGLSFNVYSGEFFMGTCGVDGAHVFMTVKKLCKNFKPKKND